MLTPDPTAAPPADVVDSRTFDEIDVQQVWAKKDLMDAKGMEEDGGEGICGESRFGGKGYFDLMVEKLEGGRWIEWGRTTGKIFTNEGLRRVFAELVAGGWCTNKDLNVSLRGSGKDRSLVEAGTFTKVMTLPKLMEVYFYHLTLNTGTSGRQPVPPAFGMFHVKTSWRTLTAVLGAATQTLFLVGTDIRLEHNFLISSNLIGLREFVAWKAHGARTAVESLLFTPGAAPSLASVVLSEELSTPPILQTLACSHTIVSINTVMRSNFDLHFFQRLQYGITHRPDNCPRLFSFNLLMTPKQPLHKTVTKRTLQKVFKKNNANEPVVKHNAAGINLVGPLRIPRELRA
ncbi:hypothetical protein HK097_003730 [Rhizophlyctis rosea]|uniref:Uncharacterized protein n=1 Tax=Rhizophlyctis rosea TaxID=64517 RepID=A0AAD5SMC6_9FUNG|nr:hypothetical protein HK097_003730 [Rhizophlyctis rosea]